MTNSAMKLSPAERDELRPDKPFRLQPPSPDTDATVGAVCKLAYASVALLLDLHGTCPRRECRKHCAALDDRACLAQFPPEAFDMACAVYTFAQIASPWMIEALQHDQRSRLGLLPKPAPDA